MTENWTVSAALDWTAGYFERNRISEARLDAELLLSSALSCPRLSLHLRKDEIVPDEKLKRYRQMITDRAKRKPVAYILGEQEFMGLRFKVNEHTLIPRPETERLAEEVIRLVDAGHDGILADLGTGSCNIPVSVGKNAAPRRIYAVDISLEALKVAQENINFHGLAGKIELRHGDLLEALRGEGIEKEVDIVISNPPYIAEDEIKGLEPELSHEPVLALAGAGSDGLDFYRRIARESTCFIKEGGYLVLEMNALRSAAIQEIVTACAFTVQAVVKDYSGHDRVLVARKTV
ncbi:MAG: peptide chain release factor N(5)-glutamine methyltransferase [Endomicrobiales bacterium]